MEGREEDLREILEKLDTLIRLTAVGAIQGKKQRDQIIALASAGLSRHEIAELVGTTPGTVSVEISTMKKSKRRRGGAK
jgi:DNA-binding NarL/FixJ family response regulator